MSPYICDPQTPEEEAHNQQWVTDVVDDWMADITAAALVRRNRWWRRLLRWVARRP